MDLFAERTFAIDTENAFKIGPHIRHIETHGFKVIKLNIGEPDFDIPDFIKQEIKHQLDINNTHYCDPKGVLSLREAICQQMHTTRGLNISPDRVVVFPGAKPSIGFSQQIYCNPGDEIIYPSPGFPIYESFIRYLDATPVPIALQETTGFTFDAPQLSALITPKTKMIFLNSPSNPTGGVVTKNTLEHIAEVILKKCSPNVRIYSDEIYESIIFDNQKHYSIAALPEMEKRTIISSGFSKSFAWTGGRVGYAVFPTAEEADIFKNLNINYFSCVPPYHQEAARIALNHKDTPKLLIQRSRILEERRNVIVKLLRALPGVSCQLPGGAFYVFPNVSEALQTLGAIGAYNALEKDLRSKTSPATLFQMFALYHHHVAVMDRRSFGKIGSEGQHFLRLSFAADIPVLQEGVARLKYALNDQAGFQKFIHNGKHLY